MIFKNRDSYLYQLRDVKKFEDSIEKLEESIKNYTNQNNRISVLASDYKSLKIKNNRLNDEVSRMKKKFDNLESLLKKPHDKLKNNE